MRGGTSGRPARPTDGADRPFGDLLARMLGVVRRGPREVFWTLPGLGLGNFLYHWMWAASGRDGGLQRAVLRRSESDPWVSVFPAVADLLIDRRDVRLTDQRATAPMSNFGEDFTEDELATFVRERLLTAPLFADVAERVLASDQTDELVVHVRRGSYYQYPDLARRYGMDTPSYVRLAVDQAAAERTIPSIRVLSNDLTWCRENLGWLASFSPVVHFGGAGTSAAEDFRDLAVARRLVLSNSTYSYWAGYVSNVLHEGNNNSEVWAPLFHMRGGRDWRSRHLDPTWRVVAELPNGWEDPDLSRDASAHSIL